MPDVERFSLDRQKELDLLGQDMTAALEIEVPADPAIAAALVDDAPFPDRDVELFGLGLSVEGGRTLAFAGDRGEVGFAAGAEASAGLGTYVDAGRAAEALAPAQELAAGLELGGSGEEIFVVLRWGYGVEASANGSVALAGGPGSVSFGVDGSRTARYAVARRWPRDTGGRTALEGTVGSWVLPRHARDLDAIEPGTWIVSEINGGLDLELGAEYGVEYNWVRATRLGGLEGDVGLRLQLGIETALDFHLAGRFAVVVGREGEGSEVRVRIFKMKKRGWGFAFDVGASARATGAPTEKKPSELIGAAMGIHGLQLLEDLRGLGAWVEDGSEKLSELVAGLTVEAAARLLSRATGLEVTGLGASFEAARDDVVAFLERWDDLDHELASVLWSVAEEHLGDLEPLIERLTETLEVLTDPVRTKERLREWAADPSFFRTPEGRLVEEIVGDRLLALLMEEAPSFDPIREAAERALAVLKHWSSGEERVFAGLRTVLGGPLDFVDRILDETREALSAADVEALEPWLAARLRAWLDVEEEGDGGDGFLDALNELRETVQEMAGRVEALDEKARAALSRSYGVALSHRYEASRTRDALVDATFDLAEPEAEQPFRDLLDGKVDRILSERIEGVTLHAGTLTHGLRRRSHMELTLPWTRRARTKLTTSLARMTAFDEEEGRVLAYELDARNLVAERGRRNASLAVGGVVEVEGAGEGGLRRFGERSFSYAYAFRQVSDDMKTSALRSQLAPYVRRYLPDAFREGEALDAWISDLDKAVDALEPENGGDRFGDTLVSLRLGLPARTVEAWLEAPRDESHARYRAVSRAVQRGLKELLPFHYFADLGRYVEERPAAYALLVYQALPPWAGESNRFVHWYPEYPADYRNLGDHPIFSHSETEEKLRKILGRTHAAIVADGEYARRARDFEPGKAAHIVREATRPVGGPKYLDELLSWEAKIVEGAREAGLAAARFREERDRPERAVEALAEFGRSVTETFNEDTALAYFGLPTPPPTVGTLVFLEAARALDPGAWAPDPDRPGPRTARPSAVLDLVVTRNGAFDLPRFLEGEEPSDEQVLIRQRLLHPAPSP